MGSNPGTPQINLFGSNSNVPSFVNMTPSVPLGKVNPQFTYNDVRSGAVVPVKTNTGPTVLMNNYGVPLAGQNYPDIRPSQAYDVNGTQYKYDSSTGTYVRNTTKAFVDTSTANDSLVGNDVNENNISMNFARNVFPGMSNDQILEAMAANGYTYMHTRDGGVFVKSAEGTTVAPNGATQNVNSGGFVDPTALSKGERVKDDSGNTYVGGTATDNFAQYTKIYKMRKGQNFNSRIGQDAAGNWVRYVVPVYDRRRYRGGRGRQQQAASDTTNTPAASQQQLVNLRVNYG